MVCAWASKQALRVGPLLIRLTKVAHRTATGMKRDPSRPYYIKRIDTRCLVGSETVISLTVNFLESVSLTTSYALAVIADKCLK